MKIKITMKDPDGVYESIEESIREDIARIEGLTEADREALIESRREALDLGEWVEYGEYVTVEIDTDEGTARVVPVR